MVTNTGNVPASSVVLTDSVANGATYVAGSLTANVPFTGSPLSTIQLTNPIPNAVNAAFNYAVNPQEASGVAGTSVSNTVNTIVFRNDFSQEISDLIHSIALEDAAIVAIANAEGAKIQRMIVLGATPNELFCVNKSVSDMLEALGTLESVLEQKLTAVGCQIVPTCMM